MRNSLREPSLRHAAALGLLHGPTELLPISSSAHTALIPWLAGWPYEDLDPRLRKSFEVALHAGTAAALTLRPPARRVEGKVTWQVAALLPPALTGYKLGGEIERRLGSPGTLLAGLLGGSFAMLVGDRRKHDAGSQCDDATAGDPGAHEPSDPRAHEPSDPERGLPGDARQTCGARIRPLANIGLCDGFALGVAQALSLIPGVSRNGATLAAARMRGFSPEDADRLSWTVGLPVIAGATLLQSARFARGESRRASAPALLVGASSAFLSTLASIRLLDVKLRIRLFGPCVVYRVLLAGFVVRRMRDNTSQDKRKSRTGN